MDDDTPTTGQVTPTNDAQAAQVDTATTQASEADVQVTSDAPEATQGDQGTSPELTATDTAEERLYAGKYKSVEDLEKSYESLQSKATRDAQEKAELARILNETFVDETPAQAPVAQADTAVFEETVEPDPIATKIEAMERKDAVRDFVFKHPDADGKAVNEVLNSDPIVKNITGYEAKLEYAYLKAQSQASPQVVAQAEEQARAETQAKIAEKTAAQVEPAQQRAAAPGNEELTADQLRDVLRDDKAFDALIQKQFPGVSKMRAQT